MTRKTKFLAIVLGSAIIVIAFVSVGVLSMNVNKVSAASPPATDPGLPLPILVPPGETGYVPQQPGKPIVAPDGRKVGKLANPPADISQTVEARFPDTSKFDETQIAFGISSVVRYKGGGHQLSVTVTRVSNAAAAKSPLLGTEKVTLTNGEVGWYTGRLPGATSNQLIIQRGSTLITLLSDLPLDRLTILAVGIVLD